MSAYAAITSGLPSGADSQDGSAEGPKLIVEVIRQKAADEVVKGTVTYFHSKKSKNLTGLNKS